MAEKEEWWLDNANARAEFYEKHFVPAFFTDWARLLVDAASIAPGQRILDVACGTGIVARVVADQVAGRLEIIGIDLNTSMIKVARRLSPDIEWHQGNVTSIPFADGSFDVVLCQAALMFFPDHVVALQEMRRVLCSSGRVAVQVLGAMPQAFDMTCEILEKAAGKEVANAWRAPFTLREPSKVTPLFAKAGFQSVKLQTHQVTARYPSMEAFLHAHVDFSSAKRVDVDAMLTIARDKLESFCTASGAMHIPMEGYIVTALKD